MKRFLIAYSATAVVFLAMDFLWLSYLAAGFYKAEIGHLLATEPSLLAALIFYIVYFAGLTVFATLPAARQGRIVQAIALGGFFGFVAYGTYDFTNMATLKDWPLWVVVVDLAWGTMVSAIGALAGFVAVSRLAGRSIETRSRA
jgi:uncharacterized membrane protein